MGFKITFFWILNSNRHCDEVWYFTNYSISNAQIIFWQTFADTKAPDTCGESNENLGLGFCPYDDLFLLSATVINDREYWSTMTNDRRGKKNLHTIWDSGAFFICVVNLKNLNCTYLLLLLFVFFFISFTIEGLYCMIVECDSTKLWKIESKELKRIRSSFTIEEAANV